MSEKKMDMAKVLAVLSQPKEEMPPLEHVNRKKLDIPYISKENKVEKRQVQIVMPEAAAIPMPLIYVPHYEMAEDAVELRAYLSQGWAVACPAAFNDNYNAQLTDDDLVFNNAALYTLRHMPEFDRERIALVGGSAGGYMTLMLTGLQPGICVSIANGPIANTYFNFYHYFNKAQGLNLKALAELAKDGALAGAPDNNAAAKPGMTQEEKDKMALDMLTKLMGLPIPFIAGLAGIFSPVLNNFPDKTDTARWEALSGVGLADCFSSPLMVNHCTSDVLVPVDQISRRFTYAKPGDSLPEEFDATLPRDLPGKLKLSLEECLPEGDVRIESIRVPEDAPESVLPYDPDKRFNLNIFDDGPIEGYGTHSSRMDVGRRDDVPYLTEMLEKTAAQTNILTPAMLKALLLRYAGKSISLPAHRGVDDTVYGSLAVYQNEVCEAVAHWKKNHGADALKDVFETVLKSLDDENERTELLSIMEEINGRCVEL